MLVGVAVCDMSGDVSADLWWKEVEPKHGVGCKGEIGCRTKACVCEKAM